MTKLSGEDFARIIEGVLKLHDVDYLFDINVKVYYLLLRWRISVSLKMHTEQEDFNFEISRDFERVDDFIEFVNEITSGVENFLSSGNVEKS